MISLARFFSISSMSLLYVALITKANQANNSSPVSASVCRVTRKRPDHRPSHQDEPGGAVVEGVLAVAEDVRALFGASVWAGVVHKRLVVYEVRHLALALVRQLGDLWVGGGERGRRCPVGQVLVDAAIEDGWAARWSEGLGTAAGVKEEWSHRRVKTGHRGFVRHYGAYFTFRYSHCFCSFSGF